MSPHEAFGLFQEDGKGPTLRASFADLHEAKEQAQKLAETEGEEFFVFSFEDDTEVVRFIPSNSKRPGQPRYRSIQTPKKD